MQVLAAQGRPLSSRGPRRIWLLGVALLLVIAAAATIAAISMARRTTGLETLLRRTEPLATAAENLYASLSQADAAAAAAFLSGGAESSADRNTYSSAIAAAGAALGTAAAGADDSDRDRAALTALVTQLPVYAGLVETARANNRQGLPVGAAYQREASNLMRSTLLPAAQTLYADQSAALAGTQRDIGSFPWIASGLAMVILAALIAAGTVLTRATRRRFNLGLMVAGLATLGWLGWLVIAGYSASHALNRSVAEGSDPLDAVVQARILAQQARTDETLYLIARGSGDANEKAFTEHVDALQALLTTRVLAATSTATALDLPAKAQSWITTHQSLVQASAGGDYAEAVRIDRSTSAENFRSLDEGLVTGVDDFRADLRVQLDRADGALVGLALGIGGLALVAAVAVAAGLWPRIREYQ